MINQTDLQPRRYRTKHIFCGATRDKYFIRFHEIKEDYGYLESNNLCHG